VDLGRWLHVVPSCAKAVGAEGSMSASLGSRYCQN
jgi:hypothetical protein